MSSHDRPMSVSCNRDGCDRTWPRDPVLEIRCPTCDADIGMKCKRPSGHGGNFVHPHAARDRLAVADGYYGGCALGICAETLADMEPESAPYGPSDQITLDSYRVPESKRRC